MRSLQHRWTGEGAVAVLRAGTPELVGYYQRLGWAVDPEGDGLAMVSGCGT